MLSFATIASLLLLIVFGFYTQIHTLSKTERLFIGSIFIIISLGGIYSAFRPGRFRRIFFAKKHKKNRYKKNEVTDIKLKGHHPTCNSFKNHVILLGDSVYCAGCNGLVLGSILAISIMGIYMVLDYSVSQPLTDLIFTLGFLFVLLNYIDTLYYHNTPVLHVISNTMLTCGFLCIVIAVSEKTGEASFGIIAIIFSVLWLDVRIHLSQYKHKYICSQCAKNCKYFE